jgi:hypothetical protein
VQCAEASKNADVTAGWSAEKEHASKELLLRENVASMRLCFALWLASRVLNGGVGLAWEPDLVRHITLEITEVDNLIITPSSAAT